MSFSRLFPDCAVYILRRRFSLFGDVLVFFTCKIPVFVVVVGFKRVACAGNVILTSNHAPGWVHLFPVLTAFVL